MTIVTQGTLPPSAETVLKDIAKDCNDEENAKEDKQVKAKKKKRSCQKLGQDKHKCCEKKIQEHRAKNPEDGSPPIEGERCYNRPTTDINGQTQVDTNPVAVDRGQTISAAIASCGTNPTRQQVSSAIGKALAGKVFPDAAMLGPPPEKTFVDFKFACPESHRSKKKSTRKNYRPPGQSRAQQTAHDALGQATGGGQSLTILC
jgi:hypothetical protein